MTYFRPYVSGPIVYVDNLATELVARGHEVTIIAARHDATLAKHERLPSGVNVIRVPVLARLSKGVIAPTFAVEAWRQIGRHDVVVVQVPQLEAPVLAALCKLRKRPCMLAYNCDVDLPAGRINRLIERCLDAGHRLAARWSFAIAHTTQDYAEHSRVMSRHLERVHAVVPALDALVATDDDAAAFRRRHGLGDREIVGICARLSAEKGFDRLLDALPDLIERWPDLCVIHVGEVDNVPGEAAYRDTVRSQLDRFEDRWLSMGKLDELELAAFYRACAVTVLPSTNSTEAFGFVQIESMANGTPVVASDLPGVRVPISTTGMGLLVPTEGSAELAAAISSVLENPESYQRSRSPIESLASTTGSADAYERLAATGVGRA